ncbi:MAG: serine hydrolase [Candidatus Riflebacteria bacterium]|nr:serine hydrolase [Candidatus Riflebacteria bacterium]
MKPCLVGVLLVLAGALGLAWTPVAVMAAPGSDGPEVAFLRTFFQDGIKDHAGAFQEAFLKAVPPAKIDEIRQMYLDKLGRFRETTGAAGSYDLLFAKGKAPCKLHLDAAGKVDGLWLGQWTFFDDQPDTLLAEFKKLPGKVSVALTRDGGEPVFELAPAEPLGVGSAFKLYVLKALEERIAAGKARPGQTIPLDGAKKSLPSGILQEWPDGTPLTLSTLANLMISISDNTATDLLMDFLGREAVEALAPAGSLPFLTTMEMFRIKYGDPARAETFAKADPAGRRQILDGIATEPVRIAAVRTSPFLVDSVEWFIPTRDLCRVIFDLQHSPALGINPGLVQKDAWFKVCFKGGSEPGVLNYTMLLRKAPASATFCLSATVNDPAKAVETDRFNELVLRLVGLIEQGAFDR